MLHGGSDVIDIQEKISQRMPEKKGLSTGDYLRIASAGMDILGAPSQGGGIKGLLASASGPLSKLGTEIFCVANCGKMHLTKNNHAAQITANMT